MAQRKSLLEEIREQNTGANLNQGVVNSARKSYDDGIPVQQETQQQGQRTSLLQEIIDADGMGNLNQDYVNKALSLDGGFGGIPGGIAQDEQGMYLAYDFSQNAAKLREKKTQAAKTGGVYDPEDMSVADTVIDRLLGVDRTQVTGEKTNWWQLLKGTVSKGLNQWNNLNWKSVNFLFGDLAEDLHALGTETINGIIEGLNYIPGVNLNYIGQNSKNLVEWGYEDATKGLEQATEKYKANANSSRAAQIVDQFGTSTVAAIPMALEAFLLGPAQAAQAGAATTGGLTYFSGLQSASGMEAAGMMASEGMKKLFSNPQFWTSYLQVAGDGYESAKEEGMSDEDAGLYGLVNGFFNALVEIGGGDEALGGIQNLPMRLQQQGGKHAVVEWFKDAVLGEAKEEVIQGALERGLLQGMQGDSIGEMFSADPNNTRAAFNPITAAQEAIGGGVVGALLGGGQTAAVKAFNTTASAVQDRAQARQEQRIQTAQETGQQLVQQAITNMDVPEQYQSVLLDDFNNGTANAQEYAIGAWEAFRLGEQGLTLEQAIETSENSDKLSRAQFEHAWTTGARKAGNVTTTERTETQRAASVPEYSSIEEFSRDFPQPQAVESIFNGTADADVNEFAAGFRAAYDMGRSGVSANYLTGTDKSGTPYVATLTQAQAQAAYDLGRQDAGTTAQQRADKTASRRREGNLTRVRGTVRGEGVTIADMKAAFNDSQNTAYRLLTRYADTTGVNIVLYNSQADATGAFTDANGRFQWKDDTIYIDINSGLDNIKNVNDLGQYTMLRTFAHEFTHFIEKWNAKEYNEFREFVFQTLEARGENVHDLIEMRMAEDASGNMTYEQASREVVADAMTDILPDSTLVQQLATEHQSIFRQLLKKLREFSARLKQYYRQITKEAPREARALQENSAYLDSIVEMWDRIAKGAVSNYQGANGETLIDQPAKPDNLPRQQKQTQRKAEAEQKQTQQTQEAQEPERRRVGMEFFRPVEVTEEEAPDLKGMVGRAQPQTREIGRDYFPANDFTSQAEEAPNLAQMAAQRNRPVSRDRFPANDFTSQAEEAPSLKDMVPKREESAAEPEAAEPTAEELPEEPTVAEVLEAAEESEKPVEPVPAKAETEKAKERLKKGVSVPVEKANADAIRHGLETRQLSLDNITLTGTVRGFNVEQRAHLIDELISAYYDGKREAKISVPYDGKFTLDASLNNVVDMLSMLKAKVTQDVIFNKKLDALLRKNSPKTLKVGDEWFITATGMEIIPITQEAAEFAGTSKKAGGYGASITSLSGGMEQIITSDYTRLTQAPEEVTFSNKSVYYRFQTEGDPLYVSKPAFGYFDGGRLYGTEFTVYRLSGEQNTYQTMKVENPDGTVAGYLLGAKINPNLKETQTMPTSLKSFSKKAMQEMAKGETRKAGRTEPAPKQEAKPEQKPLPAAEKPARRPESRFPLHQWKNGTPSQKAAYRILLDYLRQHKGLPSKDLYAICDEAFGGTQSEGKYNRKDAYDAMELAVNQYITETMQSYNDGDVENARRGIEFAQEILKNLPTQNVRTQEQLDFQQFSTPPSIAYLAAWAANINADDHVLEPSAGIGGLLSFAKAWGAETTANELSERRYGIIQAMRFDHYFNENAEHINNVLPDSIQPTVVIMNPPFSSTAGRTKSNKTSNAEAHINSALDRLADNGRLVAIVGRGMADDKYSKYWNKIRQEYTIRANIGIDGKNYTKYGTSFDVQIVVIDKVGPQGNAKTVTGSYTELSEVPEVLEAIRNDRSTEVEHNPAVESDSRPDAEPGERKPVSSAMDKANDSDSGRAESRNGADTGRGGESGSADIQRTERGEGAVPDAGATQRGTVEQQRPSQKDTAGRKPAKQSEGLRSDTGTDRAASDVQRQSEQQRSGSESESSRNGQVSADPITDDGVYTGYRVPDIPLKGTKPHPAVLVESAAMGAVEMPKATYTPHLPDSITKTGALSTEQLVSVTYAGQAHEQKLPSGERRGFFVGDGTGVGKGRTISGIIFDNFEQGRKKAIWISENTKLLQDAIRDWTDISGRGKDDIKDFSTVKLGSKIEKPEGIIFTSYDTVASKKGNLSRVDQLVEWFGKDYDGVIAFDEAHNMGNLLGKVGARGKTKGSNKAIAAVELQKKLPNARVVYVSATAATEVSGLAFASRLGLWGKGTAFTDVNDFVSKIGSAGLSAMELVVRDMKSMGMYVARSISYNGVEYDTVQHNLDPIQRTIYNTMSRAWQKTMRSVEQSLVDTGAQHNSQAKQNAIGQYFSAIQRFYNQVLTSMSMPSVIADMRKQLADGKSCVLQIVNTNQAEADRQLASIKADGGELDDMDLTPRGTLIDYLMKCYPVTMFEEYEDEDGNKRSRPVLDSKGEPVIDKKAVAKRDALIAEVNQMSIPDGPLEMLFDAFGTENVSEITGRNRRVVPRQQEDGTIKRVEESRGKAARLADISAFQNGDKRILVFSAAGGTGASYHADLRAKNQQQRVHYVLQPGWEASKAVQGFGRTHRSNEASAPIYKLVTTDIKGQKRFTSTIARRLDQLGALTKGQRDTGSGMFGASDNLETDLAKDSLREFYRRLGTNKLEGIDGRSVLQKLGLLEKFTGDYGEFKLNETVARDISKFLNRILALEVDEQNQVFDAFINIYEMEMDAAIQAGTLDRGMENVKADKIEIVDDKVIHQQEGTGAATHYVQAKVYTKPKVITTVAEAQDARAGFVGIYRTKEGNVRAVYRIADKTTDYGAIVKQYKLQSPNRSKSSVWQERTFDSNAELIPKEEWQKAWDEELKKVPEYNEDVKHMLTGSLLPIWNSLPEEGNTKVQRLIADDGKAYLGRIIAPDKIDGVLSRFGENRTKEKYTGKSLMQKALNSNAIFNLSFYRAKIHRSRVSGEWRIEYEQSQNPWAVQQMYPDMMMERINYQNRFFIPTGEVGEALLDKLLNDNPVANVVERGEDTVQYSIRRRSETESESEVYNSRALVSDETLERWLKDYASSNPDYAQAYIAYMSPSDFLRMTTSGRESRAIIEKQATGLSLKAAVDFSKGQPVQLLIDTETGKVEGHEGRHRMVTLRQNGISAVPVLLFDRRNKYSKSAIKGLELTGQDFNGNTNYQTAFVYDIQPLSRGNAMTVSEKFSEPTSMERISDKYGVRTLVEFSDRQQTLSNREVLRLAADEIDVDTLDEKERNALNIFNDVLTKLDEEQSHRQDLGRQYKEQQFTKGGSRAEADRIRAAMSVSDSKIKSLENRLLSLENKDILKQVLEKARRVVELEERKRGDETLKRYRERRNESMNTRKYRERVRNEVETLRQWLVRPSNKDMKKHVPAEIQKTVADFLESINLMSKRALATSGLDTTKADERYLKNMKKMRDAIKANVNSQGLYSGYNDLPADFIENFEALIKKTENHISDNAGVFVVNQMSAAELQQLAQTLRTLRKYITTMNSFHNNAIFKHSYDAGENTIDHLTPFEKSKKSGFIYKFLRFDYMRQSYAFEHFGKGGQSIEHELRDGQSVLAFLAHKIIDFAKKTYTAREVKTWSEEAKTFTTTDGETVTMPVTHLMSLYCLNKRPQALTHIYGDGIRVANYKDGKRVALDEGHIVTIADVQQMIQELTPRQREVADALQKYMSTETATWGNYVSMARFDVEQFTEENYFPINSDGRYLSTTADESPDNAGLYALLNSSFTKELKENADNRIILYNIFDVFANHTASMAQYRAFALPVLDALKWFNYKNDTTSVRAKLSSAFGAPLDERAGSGAKGYAEQFVINLLKAYNGTSAQGDPYDSLPLKMLHHFNGAAIAYNLRVVIQQPTAITRAAMILSPAKLTKGLGMSIAQMNKLAAEMEEHSGIAAWKALGFYDTNISRGLTDLIKQNPSLLDRGMEIGTKGAEMADRFTWAAMWYAAKDTVKRSDYATEEAYFKAVTDLFEEVIYKTQVVDSLLTKAEFLRSKGGIARQMGSFMSEPSATMSMLADAYYKYTDDLQQGMSRSEAWKRNGGNIAKTAAVYAVGQVILSAMQAVIDAWRDDDDKDPENWLNNYIQKYINAFKGNVVEELLIFGKIPGVSELYELFKSRLSKLGVFDKLGLDLYGNDISSGLAMYTKYLVKANDIITDKILGNSTNYTNYGVIYNLIRAASNLSGIPAATAWREVQDLWNNTVGYFAPNMRMKTYERKSDRQKREGYEEFVKASGLSESAYNKIFSTADADSNGKLKQDEIGPVLMQMLQDGEITQEQAEAIWNVQGWVEDHDLAWYASKNGDGDLVQKGETATAPTSNRVSFTPTAAPAATTAPTNAAVSDFESFKKAAPIYGTEKTQATYNAWETVLKPTGMSLDRYVQILTAADTDGNESLKQDELGYALRASVNSGEMTFAQASAVWSAQGWSAKHDFSYWSARH